MEEPDTEYLLGAPDDDSPPQGVCQLRYRFSVWTATDDCWLEDLFVLEPARGAGAGLGADRSSRCGARTSAGAAASSSTPTRTTRALALYERFGFSPTYKSAPHRNLFLGRRLDDR